MRRFTPLVLVLACLATTQATRTLDAQSAAHTAKRFELTVDSVMRGPDIVGYPPSDLRWSGDSRELYFEWRKPGEDEAATYVVGAGGGPPRRLSDDERRQAPPVNGVWDEAQRRVLAVRDGDIVMLDTVAHTERLITRTTGVESAPRWARHDTHVTFVRDNNLFIVPVDAPNAGVLVQLTDVAPRKADPKLTESQQFLKAEERKLLNAVDEAARKKEKAEEEEKKRQLPKFELETGQTVPDMELAPDDRTVYLHVADRAENARTSEVPNFITTSAYTEDISARTKVGDAQVLRRVAILDLETRESRWVRLDARGAGPTVTNGNGSAAAASGTEAPTISWSMPEISADGRYVAVAARSLDNKDGWLAAINPATGEARILERFHDDAWLRWSMTEPSFGWLPDSLRVWFLSEQDGWMHLYTVDASDTEARPKQLTSGTWEISAAQVSPDRQRFYLNTTEAHPGERHAYAMSFDGGARTKLTDRVGAYAMTFSPDDKRAGVVYSKSNQPPEVFVMENRPGADLVQVTTSPTPEWSSFSWLDPKLVTFKARDGMEVYARLFTPEMLGAKRHRLAPGVVFVHGAGYLQNAHRYWSTYFREYMFHHVLAAQGYVVLDIDYRASAGYGRDWRTAIYRHMGGKDLEDIIDGAGYLVSEHRVNPRRLGVYGGSYGGFITLMALFTSPDTFAAGAALRPVTDWAHYNHPYTSNILNIPQKDAEAYRQSSPIYFAEGLKGALLICHGMVDTNVHFQDSVRLAQRLVELGKENWEFAVYPVEDHGFVKASSWTDEYRRIFKLFERTLKQ